MQRGNNFCTPEKACFALHLVKIEGWTQTKAAIFLELNQGTVSHIINRRRFPQARPKSPFEIATAA